MSLRDKKAKQKVETDSSTLPQEKKRVVRVNPASITKSESNKKSPQKEDLSMRGYRTLSDGRKTTFFNTERTEEELKLIGENKPQRLTSEEAKDVVNTNQSNGPSAWNEKGTFEEQDFTKWGRDTLERLFKDKQYCLNDKFQGHATKTFTRKKLRHIFDFEFEVVAKEVVVAMVTEFSGDDIDFQVDAKLSAQEKDKVKKDVDEVLHQWKKLFLTL